MHEETALKCPLCRASSVEIEEHLSGRQLRSLWKTVGHDLSDKALGKISPESEVFFFRCETCGFRFFDPRHAGGAEFYEELMATRVYPGDTPEFQLAIQFAKARGITQVMDVGGGEGAFLDIAKQSGLQTFGVELNRDASAKAAAKGHRMFNVAFEQIPAGALHGGIEMLTLFQVVEHVPDPTAFLKAAAALVSPGGFVVVAVPSSERVANLLHHDPADWPPHHISRWRLCDLARLGSNAGLKVLRSGADPLHGRAIEWGWRLHNQLATAIGRKTLPGGSWLPKSLSLVYRALRCKNYLPFHGLSIYAVYQKP